MDRDRKLAELMGMCWHEMDRNPLNPHLMCAKCQKMWRDIPDNPDFSTDSGFVKALLWAQDDSRHEGWTWQDFATWAYVMWHDSDVSKETRRWGLDPSRYYADFQRWLFNPDTFAGVLCEFLRGIDEK